MCFFLSVSEIQFDGEPGEIAKDACAEFCNHQKLALEQLKVCNEETRSHLVIHLCHLDKFGAAIISTFSEFNYHSVKLFPKVPVLTFFTFDFPLSPETVS